MIREISKRKIIKRVIESIKSAESYIFATRKVEDKEQSGKYEAMLKKMQKKGVVFKRKVFSSMKKKSALDCSVYPFMRMLLIDGTLLFFAVPKGQRYRFFVTKDQALISAYEEYFQCLPDSRES